MQLGIIIMAILQNDLVVSEKIASQVGLCNFTQICVLPNLSKILFMLENQSCNIPHHFS